MKACILIRTEPGKHSVIAKKLTQFPGVKICFPVMGQADVALKIEVRETEELTHAVQEILFMRGIAETETLVESGT